MDLALQQLYKSEKLSLEKDFQKWLELIQVVDNTCHFAEKHQQKIADEAVHATKKLLLSTSKHNLMNQHTNSLSTASNVSSVPKLLVLTTEEHKLLAANKRCFKC